MKNPYGNTASKIVPVGGQKYSPPCGYWPVSNYNVRHNALFVNQEGIYNTDGYPQPEHCDANCQVNGYHKNLPKSQPVRNFISGPRQTSIKIYGDGVTPDKRTIYSPIIVTQPYGTMYDSDYSRYNENGERINAHYSVFPFTNRYSNECRSVSKQATPSPSIYRWGNA